MLAKALVVGMISAVTAHASAMCMAPIPVSVDSPYDYYVALTEALQLAKEARDEATTALSRGLSDGQPAATLLTALKTSQADYVCARRYIEGYTKSKNDGIQVSAEGLWTALQSLQSIENGVEQNITDMLNGKGTDVPEGTRAQQTADTNVHFNEAWQMLMMGVVASSHAAPHFDSTEHFDGITLSAKQRADIIRRLQALGPADEHEGNNPPLETSVAMLLKFFKNKQLKSFGG